MLHFSEYCPGPENLRQYLLNILNNNECDIDDFLKVKKWSQQSEQSSLLILEISVTEMTDMVCEIFEKCQTHHFITKSQSSYLQFTKENVSEDCAIALLDFAENYSFILQDAIQSFHWNNLQAMLHPIVVYYKQNGKLKCESFCVISHCMLHDTTAVHCFLISVVTKLKHIITGLKHLIYFSNSASSQYKNFENLSNLCHQDYKLSIEWNFFATSHGKSPSDGVGGTTKRLAAKLVFK